VASFSQDVKRNLKKIYIYPHLLYIYNVFIYIISALNATNSQHFGTANFPANNAAEHSKRPYSLVLFIPVGAGTVPACTRKKN
jgi:hypothetical protein